MMMMVMIMMIMMMSVKQWVSILFIEQLLVVAKCVQALLENSKMMYLIAGKSGGRRKACYTTKQACYVRVEIP